MINSRTAQPIAAREPAEPSRPATTLLTSCTDPLLAAIEAHKAVCRKRQSHGGPQAARVTTLKRVNR
jgi:hypothetical protein